MKIIFDGVMYSAAPSGGTYRYFNEIIPRISAFPNTEVNIFTGKNAASIPTGSNVTITTDLLPSGSWLPEGKLKAFLRTGKKSLQSYLLKQKFSGIENSVFHSTYYTPPPWSKITQVVTIHDLIAELVPETYDLPHIKQLRQSKSICLKTATRVVAISQQTKKDLQEVYNIPSDRIDVIYHGVDFPLFSHRLPVLEQKNILVKYGLSSPYLFFLGGRLHHKNFNRFLVAFAQSAVSKEIKLAVAGTPWEESELKLLNSLDIKSQVVWIPTLKEDELPTLYQNAQAFALPSYYEGFGLPLIEAMAAGCPVIASHAGPLPELAQNAALFFDPFDESKIASAIEDVLVTDTRNRLIQAGREQARKFSWEKSAKQHYESYQRALNDPS